MRPILVNDQEFLIRKNLFEFFEVYRTWQVSLDAWIWIDQISINQAAIGERNHQVGMMEDIYRGASETYVWLGPDPDKEVAFAMLLKTIERSIIDNYDYKKDGWSEYSRDYPQESSCIDALCTRPYFRRHWIVQELILSRHATIVYGSSTMPWSYLHRILFNLSGSDAPKSVQDVAKLAYLDTNSRFHHWGDVWYWCMRHESLCEDARDVVYGIQGLFEPSAQIEPDYSASVHDVAFKALCCYAKLYSKRLNEEPRRFENICGRLAKRMGAVTDELAFYYAMADYRETEESRANEENERVLVQILEYLIYGKGPMGAAARTQLFQAAAQKSQAKAQQAKPGLRTRARKLLGLRKS